MKPSILHVSGASLIRMGIVRTKIKLVCKQCKELVETRPIRGEGDGKAVLQCVKCYSLLAKVGLEQVLQKAYPMIPMGDCSPPKTPQGQVLKTPEVE